MKYKNLNSVIIYVLVFLVMTCFSLTYNYKNIGMWSLAGFGISVFLLYVINSLVQKIKIYFWLCGIINVVFVVLMITVATKLVIGISDSIQIEDLVVNIYFGFINYCVSSLVVSQILWIIWEYSKIFLGKYKN